MNRPEDFRSGFVRPPTHNILRASLDANGDILALEHQAASGEVAFPFLPRAMGTILGADFGSYTRCHHALCDTEYENHSLARKIASLHWLVAWPGINGQYICN